MQSRLLHFFTDCHLRKQFIVFEPTGMHHFSLIFTNEKTCILQVSVELFFKELHSVV